VLAERADGVVSVTAAAAGRVTSLAEAEALGVEVAGSLLEQGAAPLLELMREGAGP